MRDRAFYQPLGESMIARDVDLEPPGRVRVSDCSERYGRVCRHSEQGSACRHSAPRRCLAIGVRADLKRHRRYQNRCPYRRPENGC
jgi:hypothetical protein